MQMAVTLFAAAVLYFCAAAGQSTNGGNKLQVAFEWNEIDYKFADADQRWSALESHSFKPQNVIPFGLEAYGSRLFLTLPRWKDGVPATLAYVELNDTSTRSPVLMPYPSWEAHSLAEADPELVSPFRARADRCGRLWVLDARVANILTATKLYGAAQLLVYDLHNDNLLRRHVFPQDHMKQGSLFANLAIEDTDCENTFAYAADLAKPGLVVYSWKQMESWRVHHNFFHPDPMSGNFRIDGIEFQWDDGLYGLALSKADANGFANLYFHALSSTMEFSVNTAVLRNRTLATSAQNYREFKLLGERSQNAQAGASAMDAATGAIFFALPNLDAVGCWQSSHDNAYNLQTIGLVKSPVEFIFPSDVKVDEQNRLWVLSNRLHEFIYDELLPTAVNFRIVMGNVKDIIENTVCDVKFRPLQDIATKIGDIWQNVTATVKGANSDVSSTIATMTSTTGTGTGAGTSTSTSISTSSSSSSIGTTSSTKTMHTSGVAENGATSALIFLAATIFIRWF